MVSICRSPVLLIAYATSSGSRFTHRGEPVLWHLLKSYASSIEYQKPAFYLFLFFVTTAGARIFETLIFRKQCLPFDSSRTARALKAGSAALHSSFQASLQGMSFFWGWLFCMTLELRKKSLTRASLARNKCMLTPTYVAKAECCLGKIYQPKTLSCQCSGMSEESRFITCLQWLH